MNVGGLARADGTLLLLLFVKTMLWPKKPYTDFATFIEISNREKTGSI